MKLTESHDICLQQDFWKESKVLRAVSTFRLDARVRKCAHDLEDQHMLAKLSAGDMIAQEAKYHPRCLVSYYNKASAFQKETEDNKIEKVSHGIALAELLEYIHDSVDKDKAPIYKLSDCVKLYSTRLEQLGVKEHTRPHSTDLINRILAQIPDLRARREGRDVLLAFDEDIGPAYVGFVMMTMTVKPFV